MDPQQLSGSDETWKLYGSDSFMSQDFSLLLVSPLIHSSRAKSKGHWTIPRGRGSTKAGDSDNKLDCLCA